MNHALIADDDSDIRMLLRQVFEGKGWSVVEAEDGDQALEAPHATFDLIVLDQKMPGVTGDDVAVRLRGLGYHGPIIFYSAFLTRELEEKLRRHVNGDLHIVSKTDFPYLVELIRKYSS